MLPETAVTDIQERNLVLKPLTHRALALRPPNGQAKPSLPALGEIQRHDRLGGLIHEYHRAAA